MSSPCSLIAVFDNPVDSPALRLEIRDDQLEDVALPEPVSPIVPFRLREPDSRGTGDARPSRPVAEAGTSGRDLVICQQPARAVSLGRSRVDRPELTTELPPVDSQLVR